MCLKQQLQWTPTVTRVQHHPHSELEGLGCIHASEGMSDKLQHEASRVTLVGSRGGAREG